MINHKKEFKINYGGKEVILESGRMAKLADGAVLVTSGETQVLVTVCSAPEAKPGQDFFPLTVDYVEKFYSAGKFLGGFIKREAKPSTPETLNARLIDRPLRPLFPEGYLNETVVSCTVMSYGKGGDPEILAGLGASAALTLSDIPFEGPIATCKVGKIDGKLVLNPELDQWENSEFEIAVAGSSDAILMVEGEAKEHPESEILEAILFGHAEIKKCCETIAQMQKELGRPKRKFEPVLPNKTLMSAVEQKFTADAKAVLANVPKTERQNATRALVSSVAKALSENPTAFGLTEGGDTKKEAYGAVDSLLYKIMRGEILDLGKRIGGRKLDQVREIETEVSVLATPHGSSLFTRGETQVLATVTVGGSKGEQMLDRISGQKHDKFYLHYNFPPFCVGEAKAKFTVSRRELGHGNLAERALKNIISNPEEFPYTIRLACEVLESNGSSSMGSVCSGSMAMMDAGIPMNGPVAGIAMGLIKEGERYKILSDILGDEDHLGDMDFKVAGSSKGITAIQMDIKITGLSPQILKEALEQARVGRLHILAEMSKTIDTPRTEFKAGVPRIETIKIDQDKIGALIGPGGKNIKAIQEQFKVTVEVTEDGTVKVLGSDRDLVLQCLDVIDLQIRGPSVGRDYQAVVVSIKDYGAFVDIVPGVSGLVHVSEFSNDRVNDPGEYVREGDEIMVRVVEVDRMGRIKLSAKAVKPIEKRAK